MAQLAAPVVDDAFRRRSEGGTTVIEHHAEVIIPAPRAQVVAMWSHLTDFPKYMHFVEEVLPLGEGRTHWVANIVGRHEWDAIAHDDVAGRQIGWRSYAGLENAGRVTFDDVEPGKTRVTVYIAYDPPLGPVGELGEHLGGGASFEKALQRDLDNFARMVAEAPAGATDPHASPYIYNPESAVAEGHTRAQWPSQEVPHEFEW